MDIETFGDVEGIYMDIYEPVIAELRAQIEECERTLATLEKMRGKAMSSVGVDVAGPVAAIKPGGEAAFASDAFFGMTVADAARKYLTGLRATAPAKVIADALVAGGFKTVAKNFVETVRTMLSRNTQFVFVNGGFGLAEWYPGRKPPVRRVHLNSKPDSVESDPSPEEVATALEQVSNEQQPLP